ncbi:probable RNA-binding protein CG14230 isoform X1 [Battus philenor]|uniref:probable RNA-binding protein CG14230 isoform X1 n=1 Tax=Battus philenor TaxID=42288 RepID=UPI0035D0E1ED
MSHIRLFVGNIPEHLNDNDLREEFSSYGEITNLELKSKADVENDRKYFAFITLSASNHAVESCIKEISNKDFGGQKLHVTRARESFLERLQREREEARKKDEEKALISSKKNHSDAILDEECVKELRFQRNIQDNKKNTTEKFNAVSTFKHLRPGNDKIINQCNKELIETNESFVNNAKQLNSEQKRLESLKRKRQEFKEKKTIIKTGLIGIDKVLSKKVYFSDNEEESNNNKVVSSNEGCKKNYEDHTKKSLFNEEDSDTEVNFEIKKQFEGVKGQRVLDLQSHYKSDKRFKLDERFIDEEQNVNEIEIDDERVELGQSNEKMKQLSILQDVLGVSIKANKSDLVQKAKPKLGMLRYDPMHPDHAKFLAPITNEPVITKKGKKKSAKENTQDCNEPEIVVEKVEASKEQFYKISETLKEAIVQPNSFSLRNLFDEKDNHEKAEEVNPEYVLMDKKKEKKLKNPFDTSEKNPFVYDSSDTEDEEQKKTIVAPQATSETKAVWREKLFFSKDDMRLKEGLHYFSKSVENDVQKERRVLKSVMRKRIYNKDRKNQMFQKKIGGRKKSIKKSIKNRR